MFAEWRGQVEAMRDIKGNTGRDGIRSAGGDDQLAPGKRSLVETIAPQPQAMTGRLTPSGAAGLPHEGAVAALAASLGLSSGNRRGAVEAGPATTTEAPDTRAAGAQDSAAGTEDADGEAHVRTLDPESLLAQLGTGEPLESATATRMGTAFGADFAEVRVHTDGKAAALAQQQSALAQQLVPKPHVGAVVRALTGAGLVTAAGEHTPRIGQFWRGDRVPQVPM